MKSWRGCIYDQWCKMRYETKTETQKDKEIKKKQSNDTQRSNIG